MISMRKASSKAALMRSGTAPTPERSPATSRAVWIPSPRASRPAPGGALLTAAVGHRPADRLGTRIDPDLSGDQEGG